ncbi:uncharacterized protein LOC119282428 [Triticum dicoccoides]|uniref:Uncharacterized protein n=1 Tax=Triticum turgidum subsp. durum TaxID=4567 RepID=A0A9R1QXA6_TRITD|nr:uncharacterized protein LOC119282428 [Triticum dicoccoides]VAH85399.1 unnamed protein product [Triticum turgidum subsp. durum]
MGRKECISLAILALVLLAGPGAKATAFAGGAASMDAAVAVRQVMPTSSIKLEDGVAPELAVVLEMHRRVLMDSFGNSVYNSDTQRRLKAPCIAGGPYSGGLRGCNPRYGCVPM